MMKNNLLFLGNNDSLLKELKKIKFINLIGIVADRTSKVEEKYFGSSFSFGKKIGIPVIGQSYFRKNYRNYTKTIFKDLDLIFIHGYHYKICRSLYEDPKIKIINFHQSLLPKYGGRHPLNWAIIKGEKITGITFHFVDGHFDTGDIVLQKKVFIRKQDNAISLYNKTIKLAAKNMRNVFALIYKEDFIPLKQDLSKREYFFVRNPEDGEILKSDTAQQIIDKIRALVFPYPGTFIRLNEGKLIIDGVVRVKNKKKYCKSAFVQRYGSDIIIKARGDLLKVTKIRGNIAWEQ